MVTAEAREIDAADLASLPPVDVVILGEIHDNLEHHENQAAAVRAILPGALVFETLTPEAAANVGPERADAEALASRLGWAESGWPDFALYHPIFTAAPDAAVFGAALPREAVRRAITDGAGAVLGERAAAFGLDEALAPADLAERVREQEEAHCDALPEGNESSSSALMRPGVLQTGARA